MEESSVSEMPNSTETGLPVAEYDTEDLGEVENVTTISVEPQPDASFQMGDGPPIPMTAILMALDPQTQNAITAVYWRLAYLSTREAE